MTPALYDKQARKLEFACKVLPVLVQHGLNYEYMLYLYDHGQIRMRTGRDYKEFTMHLNNPQAQATAIIDDKIHRLWEGVAVKNCKVMTCYVDHISVKSVAMVDLYTLALAFKHYGVKSNGTNRYNGQDFLTLPFCHEALSYNIWGINLRHMGMST